MFIDKDLLTLASEIDKAFDDRNHEVLCSLQSNCETLVSSEALSRRKVVLYFFIANTYSYIRKLNIQKNEEYTTIWEQPELVGELVALRRAIQEPDFKRVTKIYQCKIETNLGIALYTLGRFPEALEVFDKILLVMPNFAMAICYKALSLCAYMQHIENIEHKIIFLYKAACCYKKALFSKDMYWDSWGKEAFLPSYEWVKKQFTKNKITFSDVKRLIEDNQRQIGRWQNEKQYRDWVFRHRLFLAPFNDLAIENLGNCDYFHLPPHVYHIEDMQGPYFVAYFNILKQEFISARALYYESLISAHKKHFSDSYVTLYETSFNAPLYGFPYEKLKMAFRMAYSIFDKMALFINEYFHGGKLAGKVDFRQVWYKDREQKTLVDFANSNNMMLKGLFYISKELFNKAGFGDVVQPEAYQIDKIRNFLEHRFFSIHEYLINDSNEIDVTSVYEIVTLKNLQEKTLYLLKLVRSSLITLSLSMSFEEEQRRTKKSGEVMLQREATVYKHSRYLY